MSALPPRTERPRCQTPTGRPGCAGAGFRLKRARVIRGLSIEHARTATVPPSITADTCAACEWLFEHAVLRGPRSRVAARPVRFEKAERRGAFPSKAQRSRRTKIRRGGSAPPARPPAEGGCALSSLHLLVMARPGHRRGPLRIRLGNPLGEDDHRTDLLVGWRRRHDANNDGEPARAWLRSREHCAR